MKVFLRAAYNYDTDLASEESGLRCDDPSLAVQSEKDDADINCIVRRFGLTGQLPSNPRVPQYGDFTGISDYQTALNAVIEAERAFYELPADLRARFSNDPQQLLDFLDDPANYDEAVKLGLVVPKSEPDATAKATAEPIASATEPQAT